MSLNPPVRVKLPKIHTSPYLAVSSCFSFGYFDKVPNATAELEFLVEVVVGSIYKGGGRFAEHEKVANVVHFPLPKPLNFAHSCAWAPVCPSSFL
jgi:hypothetical protein